MNDIVEFFKTNEEIKALRKLLYIYEDKQWEFIKRLRKHLDPREYKLIKLRFHEQKTYEEVGKELGVTRERVRQIEWVALGKLEDASSQQSVTPQHNNDNK